VKVVEVVRERLADDEHGRPPGGEGNGTSGWFKIGSEG